MFVNAKQRCELFISFPTGRAFTVSTKALAHTPPAPSSTLCFLSCRYAPEGPDGAADALEPCWLFDYGPPSALARPIFHSRAHCLPISVSSLPTQLGTSSGLLLSLHRLKKLVVLQTSD
eukprot:4780342-Pleurochrysis_carterae.AAC.1